LLRRFCRFNSPICYILMKKMGFTERSAIATQAMKPFRFALAQFAICFLISSSLWASGAAQTQSEFSATGKMARVALESAQSLAKQGRWPEAIELYRRVLALSPHNEAAQLGLSDAYRGVHNYEEARSILHMARRQHPKSLAILTALGSLEIEAESFDTAIEVLRSAVALAPNDMKLRNLLGTAYLNKGESAAALAQFEKVLARDPANQLAQYSRAQILADMNQNEKALADAEKVVAANPDYLPGRTLLAKILVRLKQCGRAAEVLRPAASLPALDTQALFLLGNAYECAGEPELAARARDEFAAASQADRKRAEDETQSKHLVEQANELARQNRFSEALALLEQALEKNPRNGFAYSQIAKIYFSMKQADSAQEAIAKALAIQPYQPDFLYVAGVIAAEQGNHEEALAAFERVTQVNPKEADAFFEIGKIRLRRGDREGARAAFRKASELDPSDADYRRAFVGTSVAEETRKKN
jgi:tetratricopeptide (TPR) repeat protein